VTIRVVSRTTDGVALDSSYSCAVEDLTAPRLLAAQATAQKAVRVTFDEPVLLPVGASFALAPCGAPAVPVKALGAMTAGTLVELTLDTEMTPDVEYEVIAVGITDRFGNGVAQPHDRTRFLGFRPARPPTRRFELWQMLPKHNRRDDVTGDLWRFVACLQEVTDLLLVDVDRFPDIFDFERAPEDFLDCILADLGNPFPFDIDTLARRKLAAILVEMYRQKGTAKGIVNAVRFFLGIEISAISQLNATTLVLGESELGVDWLLGPSERFARYAFNVEVSRVLTDVERRQLRAIVNYIRPAHTHFVDLIEPTSVPTSDYWVLGVSALGEESALA
jgi:phage tail-like protein